MSDYTIVNLREVEDSAPKFGLAPNIEARFPKYELGCRIAAVSLQRLAPGLRFPFGHRHAHHEGLYVILESGGRRKDHDEIQDLGPRGTVRVARGKTHH